VTTPTIDVEYLDEAALDDSVPCQILKFDYAEWVYKRCGSVAIARVKIACPAHVMLPPEFVCQGCLDTLKSNKVSCRRCYTENGMLTPLTYKGES
jgi:hypothetical protein